MSVSIIFDANSHQKAFLLPTLFFFFPDCVFSEYPYTRRHAVSFWDERPFYIIFNQPGKVDWESILTGFVKTVGIGPIVALIPNPVVLVWGRREYRSRQIAHGEIRLGAMGRGAVHRVGWWNGGWHLPGIE